MELVNYSTSIYSLIPPILALLLAIVTRKVILSLSIGIITGALMLTKDTSILDSIPYLWNHISALVYSIERKRLNRICVGHNKYYPLLVLLGILTALLTVSGSNQAFAEWAQKRIKGRRGAKLMAAALVFVTFIDDYFHSLAVGAIARPVTDKFNVSRAKISLYS